MNDHAVATFALEVAELEDAPTGRALLRLVPFGVSRRFEGGAIRFEAGAIELGDEPVPLTMDHGPRVLDRIGVLEQPHERDDGLYSWARFSDTPDAQAVRTLLVDGAVSDVSVGIAPFKLGKRSGTDRSRVMSGPLDHVSIVPRGRFGDAHAGSKALAVHATQEGTMLPNDDGAATHDDAPTPVATFTRDDADELRAEMRDELRSELAEFGGDLDAIRELLERQAPRQRERDDRAAFAQVDHLIYLSLGLDELAEHAIADVVGDVAQPNSASGLAPTFYWAGGLQQNVDQRRPLFANAGTAEFPAYGNDMQSAKVTQEVSVGQSAEKAEPSSQALHVAPITFPVVAHKGVVDVSMELMRRSNPDVMRVLRNSYMRQYAIATNADIAAKALAAGGATGAVLDTTSYGAFIKAVAEQSNAIEDATGLPGDRLAVTSTQWIEILSFTDGGGRRIFAPIGPENADGVTGPVVSRSIELADGTRVFRDYSVAAAIQYNSATLARGEAAPEVMADRNLKAMGYDVGIFGETVVYTWAEGLKRYQVT